MILILIQGPICFIEELEYFFLTLRILYNSKVSLKVLANNVRNDYNIV
jgi:hypothetical protein